MFATVSRPAALGEPTGDPIHLVTQFFLPADPFRLGELQRVLLANASNPFIATITLLNERIYTESELGIACPKITQTVVGRRLLFSDAWTDRKPGYTVLVNADIFLDSTIAHVQRTNLHDQRAMMALLRYEYPSGKLFGPRADSQDTWIVHSSLHFEVNELKAFRFPLGKPGCDNKVCYLFAAMGVTIYNDPLLIHTHHCHADGARAYPGFLPPPYLFVCPADTDCILYNIPLSTIQPAVHTYDFLGSHARLAAYLRTCPRPFVVPRVAGIENNTACSQTLPDRLREVMKNNAGIHFTDAASVSAYREAYLKPFQQCHLYASWEPWSNYTRHIETSQRWLQERFPKPQVAAFAFDVFHYLSAPWTHALRGCRLLIVSPFVDMIQTQPPAYCTDLFPDCSFVYLKPPQTHGTEPSRVWTLEFADLCSAVDALEFDVALCSCGGYGNPLCGYIYSKGRSAIYVGGVLQMYFGLYGGRWIKERKEMLTMHLTSDWKRPTVKPQGHAAIESSCYW